MFTLVLRPMLVAALVALWAVLPAQEGRQRWQYRVENTSNRAGLPIRPATKLTPPLQENEKLNRHQWRNERQDELSQAPGGKKKQQRHCVNKRHQKTTLSHGGGVASGKAVPPVLYNYKLQAHRLRLQRKRN